MTCLTRCSKSNSSLYSNGRIKFLLLEFFKLNTSYYNIINFGNKLIIQLTVLLTVLLIILLIKILNLWKKALNDIIKAVYAHIAKRYNINNIQVFEFITNQADINNQSGNDYILDYYNNVILKDNKNNSVIIEDVDKVNFEELTETDKKVIASRKYMCHEYVKELIRYINKLINIELSNDRRAVDETAVIMYAIQAINRDVVNAVGDTQRILELIKQKRP